MVLENDPLHVTSPRSTLGFSYPTQTTLHVRLAGSWCFADGLPSARDVQQQFAEAPHIAQVTFDTTALTAWDTGLLTFLIQCFDVCEQHGAEVDRSGLPQGVLRLLALAEAVPERQGVRRTPTRVAWLSRVGMRILSVAASSVAAMAFLGDTCLAFGQLLRGHMSFRRKDFGLILQDCSARALPIVSLISFLVGLILAFVGAVQLQPFGANIYVADLVGLGMAREMGAMMTGIIMAGRTGAAFAAQLGTMRVNEEIDALTTMGFSPMEFLVLPRMLALMAMLPLLCLYADFMGILGGLVVGVGMLDLELLQYVHESISAMRLLDFGLGLIKSAVYGVLIAIAGCYRGMQCGNSSAAVGEAATSAVVTSIVWIVVASAILTVIYDALGL
jgi:phospholipid/cholesterol/gamma-HCH transport system permease protein